MPTDCSAFERWVDRPDLEYIVIATREKGDPSAYLTFYYGRDGRHDFRKSMKRADRPGCWWHGRGPLLGTHQFGACLDDLSALSRPSEETIHMSDDLPISHEHLRNLFEHLDRTSMTGYQCDHSFKLTQAFLEKNDLPSEDTLAWLGENGAGCDCEIMLNVAAEWEDEVGYVPPDEDSR